MQLPLLGPESNWRAPRLSDLPDWSSAKRVAIDIETCDPLLRKLGPGTRRGAYIAGYSVAIEDGPSFYVPLKHLGGDNVEDPTLALAYLRDIGKNFTGELVGMNLSYDLDFLQHVGIHFPQNKFIRDVMCADSLIDELQDGYSLERIANTHLGIGKNEGLLRDAAGAYGLDPKKEMWKLPARFVGEYATSDADLPLKILRRQEKLIDDQDLWNIWNLESKVLPVLVKMRARGVRVDLNKLAIVERWSEQQETIALQQVYDATGVRIRVGDVWKADAVAPALHAIGVQVPLTPKTRKPSIDKHLLGSIPHPVAQALDRARKVNKVRSTFVNSLHEHMIGDRIHCTFNQLRASHDDDEEEGTKGAAYGRLSCSDPNLQQQPANDPEIGPMWRDVYIPDEGGEFCSIDYSQQEPRMTVHYAVLTKMGIVNVRTENGWVKVDADASALAAAEAYRNDPSTDNHQMMADMANIKRKPAKIIFLGLCYGMGGAKLCRNLGLPTIMAVKDPISKQLVDASTPHGMELVAAGGRKFEAAGVEGQRLLDTFDLKVPFVRALSKAAEKFASKKGYIRTLEGRKCRFPKDEYGNFDWVYKALNRLIQGSSADQTKKAIVELDAAGYPLQLQVHDEICSTVTSQKQAREMAEIMLKCSPLQVPSKCDIEMGVSWGQAKGITS
jgi:DNA polymerase I-like protein with 3'-5' exonuclease and polymerase domains